PEALARALPCVVDTPQFGTLLFGIPAMLSRPDGEHALLGSRLFLVSTGTTECRIETVLVERLLERLRLHDIGVNVRPVCEGSDACVDSVLVDVDEEIQAVATSGLIAKGDHLAELPRGVDVKK